MQETSPAPRRRPLWRLFIAPVLLLIAAAAWSAFWFYAASEVGVRADAWRAQEARSGRNFDCAKRTVAGFPFRFEISCEDASVKLVSQTASNTLFAGKLAELHGRIVEGSPSDHPVIETVLQIHDGSIQGVHPVLAEAFKADVRTRLTGLKDFSPKPWPQRFRELAAEGGKVEIVQSRI